MRQRALALRMEAKASQPVAREERFAVYGIMGLPFASGHVLALRRVSSSSLGPDYTTVWHRDPAGRWTFYSDVEPRRSCGRYFGGAVERMTRAATSLTWIDPWRLAIAAPEAELAWEVWLAETPATRLLNGLAGGLLAPLWHWPPMLSAMARLAGWALGAGELRLFGDAPNGQFFRANPRRLMVVAKSRARIGGVDLGTPAPIAPQARLGDFLIPQRGLFVVGSTVFGRPPPLSAPADHERFDNLRRQRSERRLRPLPPGQLRGRRFWRLRGRLGGARVRAKATKRQGGRPGAEPGGMNRQETRMNGPPVDTLIRHAAKAMSRRGSFRVLGGAAVTGTLAAPAVARAGKAGKKGQSRCKRLRDHCVAAVVEFCAPVVEPPLCEGIYGSCCEHFARRNPRAGFDCLLIGD